MHRMWRKMTGKFRKVASHYCTGASLWAVPKLARRLCPLEPWHVNCVSFSTKCSLDISSEYILIDWDAVPHLPKGNIAFPLMESPANIVRRNVTDDES